jgi:hypothetical protein
MLWRYTPTLDRGFPKDSVQRQPGVAIDDGLDVIGQVDGYLTALDRKTGKVEQPRGTGGARDRL